MLIEKAGCVTFYYATKIGDWYCDIHASEIVSLNADGTVKEFKTYTFANEGGIPPVKVGKEKYHHTQRVSGENGFEPLYIGLYLAKEHALPEGYSEVVK